MTHREDTVTTVKVPRTLRERIARDAAASGLTAAAFLAEAIDRWERDRRLKAVRDAYAIAGPDESYRAETESWDAAAGDADG